MRTRPFKGLGLADFGLNGTLVFRQKMLKHLIERLRPSCSLDNQSGLDVLLNPPPKKVIVSVWSMPNMPADSVQDFPVIMVGGHKLMGTKISRGLASTQPGLTGFVVVEGADKVRFWYRSNDQFKNQISSGIWARGILTTLGVELELPKPRLWGRPSAATA